ncbi:hypothetical protein [Bacillus pseudomycoides]|uniref:hypothetical protein n=1 Tax=Bacillus pseudomycoides TaxID=64104 RepID=UPI0002D34E04|nr:hypothetical protein [Bacillus pseudomycoides]PGC43498.1 hypothetical protein COM18_04030 [Bacillus pseudomycoides]
MTNLKQLQSFLESNVGQRMMKIAQEEENIFQAGIKEKREQLNLLKQNAHYSQFGTFADATKVMLVEGVPVKVKTDQFSRILTVKPISAEDFKSLPAHEMNTIKQLSPIVHQKLKHGISDFDLSDKYFELMSIAEESMPIEVFDILIDPPTSENSNNFMSHYDSVEDYRNGIPAFAKEVAKARTAQNTIELNREIIALEKNIKDSLASKTVLPLPELEVTTMEGTPAQADLFGGDAE